MIIGCWLFFCIFWLKCSLPPGLDSSYWYQSTFSCFISCTSILRHTVRREKVLHWAQSNKLCSDYCLRPQAMSLAEGWPRKAVTPLPQRGMLSRGDSAVQPWGLACMGAQQDWLLTEGLSGPGIFCYLFFCFLPWCIHIWAGKMILKLFSQG